MATSGENILVVENDPDIIDLISRQALQPSGYRVTVVERASVALQQALHTPPDLLIANLNLPGLNAKDLLVALSSQGINAPFVVIARKGQEQSILQAFRMGAVDYLSWPAKDVEVVSVVERALRQTREARAHRHLNRQYQQVNEELQRKIKQLTTLISLGQAIASITDQRKLFKRIIEGAVQVSNADLGWIILGDDTGKSYQVIAHCNLPEHWANRLNQLPEDGITSLVMLSGETLFIHGEPLEKFMISGLGKAAAIVPIKVQRDVIGLMFTMHRVDTPFDDSEQHVLEAVANFASISLVNARLFRALEQTTTGIKSGEKRQKVLLDSFRGTIREELKKVEIELKYLATEKAGTLNADQQQALQSAQETLLRLSHATGKKALPADPALN